MFKRLLPILAFLGLSSWAIWSSLEYYTSPSLRVKYDSSGRERDRQEDTRQATAAKAKSSNGELFKNIDDLLGAWKGINEKFKFGSIKAENQGEKLQKINDVLNGIPGLEKVSIKLIDETTYSDEELNKVFKKLCTADGDQKWPMPIDVEGRLALGEEIYQDQDFTIDSFVKYKKEYMGGKSAVYKVFLVQEKEKTVGMLILKKLKPVDIRGHLKEHQTKMTEPEKKAVRKATKKNTQLHGVSLDVVCARGKRNLGKYLVAIGKLYADNVNGNVLTTLEATANSERRNDKQLLEHYNMFTPAMGFTYILNEKFYHVPTAKAMIGRA